jgi:hypothetical protein
LERNLIVERVRAGMRRARLEGRHIGRRPVDVDRIAVLRERDRARASARSPRHTASPVQPSAGSSSSPSRQSPPPSLYRWSAQKGCRKAPPKPLKTRPRNRRFLCLKRCGF